jgi:hypothetical protein
VEQEAIAAAVGVYVTDDTFIDFVNLSPEELIPLTIKSNYTIVFMYDFYSWNERYNKDLLICRMPRTVFFIPQIFHKTRPTEDDLRGEDGEVIDPWVATELAFVEYLFISFIPNEDYCVLCPT